MPDSAWWAREVWGSSLDDRKAFPDDVKRVRGYALARTQAAGESMVMSEEVSNTMTAGGNEGAEADSTASSGNVFADLEIAEPEEARVKAEPTRRIGGIIGERRLTQAQSADLLGIDQPEVSALLRGHLSGFSTERLFKFLNALDRDVQIVITAKPQSRAHAGIRVTAE